MDERLKHGYPEITQPQNVDVFLLCGGKGTRLKASEEDQLQRLPKPLVPIDTPRGNIRMIDNAILGLTESGFTQLTLLIGRDSKTQGSEIKDYVVSTYGGLNPSFSRENTPLGTAGAAYEAFLFSRRDNAIIIPIDTLFPFDMLCLAIQAFSENNTGIMWVVTSNPGVNAQNTNRIVVNDEYVLRDEEGKTRDVCFYETESLMTSTGVIIASKMYFLEKYRDFNEGNRNRSSTDLYRDFIPWLLQGGEKISFFDVRVPTPDLGTPERLKQFGRKN